MNIFATYPRLKIRKYAETLWLMTMWQRLSELFLRRAMQQGIYISQFICLWMKPCYLITPMHVNRVISDTSQAKWLRIRYAFLLISFLIHQLEKTKIYDKIEPQREGVRIPLKDDPISGIPTMDFSRSKNVPGFWESLKWVTPKSPKPYIFWSSLGYSSRKFSLLNYLLVITIFQH